MSIQSISRPIAPLFMPLACNLRRYAQKITTLFWSILEKCKNFYSHLCIKWSELLHRHFHPLTAEQRENRIRTGTENIRARLARELQHAQHQMANEPNKAFLYHNAPQEFPAHEEQIGNYRVGICHYQGARPTMEDEHIALKTQISIGGNHYPITLFGICDGHGGSTAAQYVKNNIEKVLTQALVEFNPKGLSDVGIWNALKMTCVRLNRNFFKDYRDKPKIINGMLCGSIAENEGTTAAIAMILDGKLWTANVGDSRIVLNQNGMPMQLSEDEKPQDRRYKRSIEHRGGSVQFNAGTWRINGALACARSIGDHSLHGANSARPKITQIPLSSLPPNTDLYIGCDGIFDVTSSRQLIQAAHTHSRESPQALAKNLVYSAFASGSTDNISLLVIRQ